MTKKEFEEMYCNLFKDGDASRFANHLFRKYDKSGDKSIDFGEFIYGLSITCHGRVEDKLRWAFNKYDNDNSGTVTKDALREIIRSIYEMMGDKDHEEHEKSLDDEDTPEKLTDCLFLQMDEDEDGEVTLEEFVEVAKVDATILKLLQKYCQ